MIIQPETIPIIKCANINFNRELKKNGIAAQKKTDPIGTKNRKNHSVFILIV